MAATGLPLSPSRAAAALDDPARIREIRYKTDKRAPAANLRAIRGVYDARWLSTGELLVRYGSGRLSEGRLREKLAALGAL